MPDCWGARTACRQLIELANARLHALTGDLRAGEDDERGYVCTFSALVLEGRRAHLFPIGDSRIARVRSDDLEILTRAHRIPVSPSEHHLARALGMRAEIDVDIHACDLTEGDVFVLTTDGVHDHVTAADIVRTVVEPRGDLDCAARALARLAFEHGGEDDRTVRIVRVDTLPDPSADDPLEQDDDRPLPPVLEPPTMLDGYRVLRRLHADHRSHIHLARDEASGRNVVLKLPAVDLASEPGLLRHFVREEWIARQVSSPHLLKAFGTARPRRLTYLVFGYVDGVTLRQWMNDHPKPELDAVRDIVTQIVEGLRALHRMGMVHRDLRPENVLIDRDGTVTIIDFGSVRIGGLADAGGPGEALLGTHQYTAPECLAGAAASWRSDLFALGVIACELLVGRLPYGDTAGRVRTRRQQSALRYRSALDDAPIPPWVDGALARAVHRDPLGRHEALSEFVTDLRRPNPRFVPSRHVPLAERHPVRFWQTVSALLALIVVLLLVRSGV